MPKSSSTSPNREGLENKKVACFINLCIMKLGAVVICLPEKMVVAVLEETH